MNKLFRNKKCLVTGAAGFVASHLTDYLLSEGAIVYGIDDMSHGSMENIQEAVKNKNFVFIKSSLTKNNSVAKVIMGNNLDYIFHLAATNLLKSIDDPMYDLSVNCKATLNILLSVQQLKHRPVLIYSSSGSVYGEPAYKPQGEDHPLNPSSPYGISKLAAEKYVLLWNKLYGVQSIALRYYNVYGPRQNYKKRAGVIGIFIDDVLNDHVPVIEGTGDQERCFTYVQDVVRANVMAALSKGAYGQAFNIASKEITTINELASIVIKACGKKIKPIYVKRRIGDIDSFQPSIDKAKKYLGYKPSVKLKVGINETIEWFNKQKTG